MCNYISIGGVSFILLFRAFKILALRFKKRLLGSRFIYVSKNDSRQPATFYKWIGFVLETFVQLAPLFSPAMNERTGDLGLGESCKNWTDQRNTSKYLVGKQRGGERAGAGVQKAYITKRGNKVQTDRVFGNSIIKIPAIESLSRYIISLNFYPI